MCFKQFHCFSERQTGKKLKCIRSDNGGEYIGPFDAYYREHRIQHQKTPPKTPQLNGLAERMNRTLVKRDDCSAFTCRVACLLFGCGFVYGGDLLINLTPCVPLRLMFLTGFGAAKMFPYHHFSVFGCKASVHIPKDERSKLDVKNKPCVFLGYGQDELGYRLYDPVQKKLVRSRDVEFDEDQTLINHGVLMVRLQEQPNLDEEVILSCHVPIATCCPLRTGPHRVHHPSTCYYAYVYVLLTVGGRDRVFEMLWKMKHKKEWAESFEKQMGLLIEDYEYTPREVQGQIEWVKRFQQKKGGANGCSRQAFLHGDLDNRKSIWNKLFTLDNAKVNIEKMDRVPYASAVGSLMYAMVCTRPDLAHAVGVVSRFLSNPGGAVSWQSRLQKCVALSTTEAEYVAATEACKELLWLKRFLQELGFKQQRYAVLCDNQSTIHLAKNSMFHLKKLYILISVLWIRDAIEDEIKFEGDNTPIVIQPTSLKFCQGDSSLKINLPDHRSILWRKQELSKGVKLEDHPLGDEKIMTNSRIIGDLNSKHVSESQEVNPAKGQLVIDATIDQERKRLRPKIEKVSLARLRSNVHINLAPTLKKCSSRQDLTFHQFLPVSNIKSEYQGDVSS
ncbi:retrovirus-related pol polyprotein from transposon TNT 1-94 [Tanacetum coccineum]